MYTNFAKFCGFKFSRIVKCLRGLLYIHVLFTCALSLMEIEGFTAILPKLKSINQYDCHFTLSKNGIVLILN